MHIQRQGLSESTTESSFCFRSCVGVLPKAGQRRQVKRDYRSVALFCLPVPMTAHRMGISTECTDRRSPSVSTFICRISSGLRRFRLTEPCQSQDGGGGGGGCWCGLKRGPGPRGAKGDQRSQRSKQSQRFIPTQKALVRI